ncbi:MAG: DUF748 domain-containing protein [Polyangiales bacterium]
MTDRRWWQRKRLRWPIGIVVFFVAARIALPFVVEWKIDKELGALDGYYGKINDVDIQLWRGGYVLEGIEIVKTGAGIPTPFFKSPRAEVSVQWRALFDGAIVADGSILEPQLNFVKGPTEAESQYGEGVDWQKEILSLVPLDINKFEVIDGDFHYRDFHSDPPVNVYVQSFDAVLRNLSNVVDETEDLPAEFYGKGLILGSGGLTIDAKMDLLAPSPEFTLDLEIKTLKLTQLNPLLKAYVGIDAEAGLFSLYAEVHGTENSLDGYAKPILEGVEIHEPGESGDFLDRAGDALVGAGLEILENQPHDRIATRVPISGSLEDIKTNPWVVVFGILRNAFINVFTHGLGLNRSDDEGGKGADE